MSITDELRREVADYPFRDNRDFALFEAIADRIDAEHEKAMNNAGQLLADAESDRNCYYLNWQDCKQKVLQGNITFDELNARIESLEDELSHCIELPKDADGIPIHEGDVMKHPACVNTSIVCGIGHNTFFTRDNHGEFYRHPAGTYVHYHAPTIEDVLREFGRGWHEQMNAPETFDIADYVERYAAKLQLREDA